MSTSIKLVALDGVTFKDLQLYRSVVGSLQYFSFAHLDILYVVNKVYQFMHSPKISHWQTVKRILCYLINNSHFGLHFNSNLVLHLSTVSDTSWVVVLMIENLLMVYVFILDLILYLGVLKSNPPLSGPPLRPNTRPLPIPLVNLSGYNHS